jgi:hypothetical protein
LAHQLGGYAQSAHDVYSGAEQSQAASDAALSQRLSGGGAQQAQDLGSRLASINAPGAVNSAVGDATQNATGSGNALYATGSASLANLIAAGAAEQSYAGRLPGIADLSGIQQAGSLQGSLASQLADKTATLQGQVPGIVSGLQTQRSTLLANKEKLRGDLSSFFDTRAKQKQALAQERQALGLKKTTAKTSAQQKDAAAAEKKRSDLAKEANNTAKLNLAAKNAAAKRAAGDTKAKQPSASLSHVYGYVVDANGDPILDANGKRIPIAKTSKSKTTKSSPFDVTPTVP